MKWKVISISFIVFLAAVVGCLQYYRFIQKPVWAEQSAARQIALQETAMVQADKAAVFHGENVYRIVFGKDAEARRMIVWVGEDAETVHAAYEDEGISSRQVIEVWRARYPKAKLLHAVPGVYHDRYVWEIFYRMKEDQGMRYYYDYYLFEDGEKLLTLTMALDPS